METLIARLIRAILQRKSSDLKNKHHINIPLYACHGEALCKAVSQIMQEEKHTIKKRPQKPIEMDKGTFEIK